MTQGLGVLNKPAFQSLKRTISSDGIAPTELFFDATVLMFTSINFCIFNPALIV